MSAAGEGRPPSSPPLFSTYDVGGGISPWLQGTGLRWSIDTANAPRTCSGGELLAAGELPPGHAPVSGPLEPTVRVWIAGGASDAAYDALAAVARSSGFGNRDVPRCFWTCPACALRLGLATDSPLARGPESPEVAP